MATNARRTDQVSVAPREFVHSWTAAAAGAALLLSACGSEEDPEAPPDPEDLVISESMDRLFPTRGPLIEETELVEHGARAWFEQTHQSLTAEIPRPPNTGPAPDAEDLDTLIDVLWVGQLDLGSPGEGPAETLFAVYRSGGVYGAVTFAGEDNDDAEDPQAWDLHTAGAFPYFGQKGHTDGVNPLPALIFDDDLLLFSQDDGPVTMEAKTMGTSDDAERVELTDGLYVPPLANSVVRAEDIEGAPEAFGDAVLFLGDSDDKPNTGAAPVFLNSGEGAQDLCEVLNDGEAAEAALLGSIAHLTEDGSTFAETSRGVWYTLDTVGPTAEASGGDAVDAMDLLRMAQVKPAFQDTLPGQTLARQCVGGEPATIGCADWPRDAGTVTELMAEPFVAARLDEGQIAYAASPEVESIELYVDGEVTEVDGPTGNHPVTGEEPPERIDIRGTTSDGDWALVVSP